MKKLRLCKKEIQFIKEMVQNYINDTFDVSSEDNFTEVFVIDKIALSNLMDNLEDGKLSLGLINAFLDCLIYKPVYFNNAAKDKLFSLIAYKIAELVEERIEQ